MADIERYTPKEEAAVLDLVIRAERSHNPMVFSEMLAKVSKEFRKHPLKFVENELRSMQSGLYLVASPMTSKMGQYYSALMPHTGSQEYPFGMALFMGEQDVWRAQLRAYDATPEVNSDRLDRTGFLSPKRGSILSYWANAAHN